MAGVLAEASFGLDSAVVDFGWRADSGEPWRLLTSQFVHLGHVHLAANLFAAALIVWSCNQFQLSTRLPAATLATLAGVGLGLQFGPWAITWYVGMSGLLHGLFAWLCLHLAVRASFARPVRKFAGVLYLGGWFKVLITLTTPLGATGWLGIPQVTPVHLYGYLAGTLWALLRRTK